MNTTKRTPRWLVWALGLTVLYLASGGVLNATEAAEVPRKLERQINIMEKVINEVLVESPNLLVASRSPSHGIYLDEFGVLFTFEASLVDRDSDWSDWGDWWKNNVRIERDGDKVVIYRDEGDDEDADKKKKEEAREDWDEEDWEAWKQKRDQSEAKLYERGKRELALTLLDYGDTLTGLRDSQWVAIAAFLKNADYFAENRISRLILKARVGDLRGYSAGDISEERMLSMIVEEEY
jgi:hypothetical protein